jgi:hypothetical protein
MLKRSFAEFHAQRGAPEALEALQRGQERLAELRARPWPPSALGTTREAVEAFFAASQRIEALSMQLQARRPNSVLFRLAPSQCLCILRAVKHVALAVMLLDVMCRMWDLTQGV